MHTKLFATFIAAAFAYAGVTNTAHAAEPPLNKFSVASQSSATVGKRYFNAYINKDWNTLESLLADNSSFDDPTAMMVFGPVIQQGKTQMMKNFRENYAPISMSFDLKREMFAADHAFFEGELNWTYQQPGNPIVTEKMPMIIMLKVENGQVTSHRDYADYHPYFAAVQRSRKTS